MKIMKNLFSVIFSFVKETAESGHRMNGDCLKTVVKSGLKPPIKNGGSGEGKSQYCQTKEDY